MRVVVNLLQTLKPKAGIGHYAARLFAALGEQLPTEGLHAFPGPRLAAVVQRVQRVRASGHAPAGRSNSLARAKAAVKDVVGAAGRGCLRLAFREACRRGGYDLYHEPNFIPLATDIPTVVTVHDLSVILHPEWHPTDRVRDHERRFRHGLSQVRHILADTHAVRSEIITHLGVPPEQVTAVHLGVGSEYFTVEQAEVERTRNELCLPSNYLLFVGTIEPRKNVLSLLRAYRDLPDDLRRRCPLVLAGGWGWKAVDVAEFLNSEGAANGVLHLGYMPDQYLPGLYAGARALVYPSFYEGFGLPPIEMLATGNAVISSTAAALREVLGTHAHFVEPLDVAGWRTAMACAITDEAWRASLRHGGREHAAAFTWDRCAAETTDVYRSMLAPLRRAA